MALVRGDAQLGSLHANLPGNVSEQCSCERMITQPVCGCGGKGGGGPGGSSATAWLISIDPLAATITHCDLPSVPLTFSHPLWDP